MFFFLFMSWLEFKKEEFKISSLKNSELAHSTKEDGDLYKSDSLSPWCQSTSLALFLLSSLPSNNKSKQLQYLSLSWLTRFYIQQCVWRRTKKGRLESPSLKCPHDLITSVSLVFIFFSQDGSSLWNKILNEKNRKQRIWFKLNAS